MFKAAEGSTQRLIELCVGYFFFYVVTGVAVKYYLGSAEAGLPGMSGIQYMVYSTLGGTILCTAVVLALRWYRLASNRWMTVAGMRFPSEYLYIIPSGICTAVVIPTTTLMYTLPISVMVAMVIMRGSIIVISRAVDTIQIRQGILHRKVFWQENVAVIFALAAVAVHLVWENGSGKGGFDFLSNTMAVWVLGSYITAYAIRIYIMNYYKNTRPKDAKSDNRGFFAVEQLASSSTLLLVTAVVFFAPQLFGGGERVLDFRGAIIEPLPRALDATISGMAFGVVAFFSVFIFMFKGRTATFAGLVNRLTSLIAGTAATVLFAVWFGGKLPKVEDWVSLGFILIAVAFLTLAERRRAGELGATQAASAPRPERAASSPVLKKA